MHVPVLVERTPVEVDDPRSGRTQLLERVVDPLVQRPRAAEARPAHRAAVEAAAVELGLPQVHGVDPAGDESVEEGRVRDPHAAVDGLGAGQLVEHLVGVRVQQGVAHDAVRAGQQTGCQRGQRIGGGRGEARAQQRLVRQQRPEEGGVCGAPAQKPGAQPVDEDDDRGARGSGRRDAPGAVDGLGLEDVLTAHGQRGRRDDIGQERTGVIGGGHVERLGSHGLTGSRARPGTRPAAGRGRTSAPAPRPRGPPPGRTRAG